MLLCVVYSCDVLFGCVIVCTLDCECGSLFVCMYDCLVGVCVCVCLVVRVCFVCACV